MCVLSSARCCLINGLDGAVRLPVCAGVTRVPVIVKHYVFGVINSML